jgi:hypothetical protein
LFGSDNQYILYDWEGRSFGDSADQDDFLSVTLKIKANVCTSSEGARATGCINVADDELFYGNGTADLKENPLDIVFTDWEGTVLDTLEIVG